MRRLALVLSFAAASVAAKETAPIDPISRELLSWPISAAAITVTPPAVAWPADVPPSPPPDLETMGDAQLSYSANDIYMLAIAQWSAMEPLVTRWLGDPSPFRRAAAAGALYKRALARGEDPQRVRTILQALVIDRTIHPSARQMALDILMLRAETRWQPEERDDLRQWFLSLFDDPTLTNARIDNIVGRPLAEVVAWSPERFTAAVARLARKPATRQNAALALSGVLQRAADTHASDTIRRQALDALVPWLADPAWAADSQWGGDRVAAIVAAGELGGARVVEALRKGFAREPHNVAILSALAAQGDAQALAVAMSDRESIDESSRRAVWSAVLRAHAAPPADVAASLFEWIRAVEKAAAVGYRWNEVLPWRTSLGHYVALNDGATGAAVVNAIAALYAKEEDPRIANGVLAVLAASKDDAVRDFMLRELPHADARVLAAVAAHARDYAGAARRVAQRGPVVALLAGDDVSRFLARRDTADRILVVARLAQIDIPAAQVAASAADPDVVSQYLAHVDTPEHRALLRQRFPGVVSGMPLPTGSDPQYGMATCANDDFAKMENALLAEVKSGQTAEVFALFTFSGYPCGYTEEPLVVRDSLAELRAQLDAAGPVWTAFAFQHHELFHVSAGGARRIVFNAADADPRLKEIVRTIVMRASTIRKSSPP
ncbi:MAG TPA: hypothetical protein VFN10_07990 [Thermoanaerobaculia bacterium]|nr:hypothetical protein [Thermoanaerobaculia bacterium]